MDIPLAILETFSPSPDALWNKMRPAIDNQMLRDIAMADYGNRADEACNQLRVIRDRGELPQPLPSQLDEVLQLTRWCDLDRPEKPPFAPGPTGQKGHLTRLFACAILLRAADTPACLYCHDSYDSTIAQALQSSKALGHDFSQALGQYLAWRPSQNEPLGEQSYSVLGLLILLLRTQPGQGSEPLVEHLAEVLKRHDELVQAINGPLDSTDPCPSDFSIQQGFWKPLAKELNEYAERIDSCELRERLQFIALTLEE